MYMYKIITSLYCPVKAEHLSQCRTERLFPCSYRLPRTTYAEWWVNFTDRL